MSFEYESFQILLNSLSTDINPDSTTFKRLLKDSPVKLIINSKPQTTLTFSNYDEFTSFLALDPHVIDDFNNGILRYSLKVEFQLRAIPGWNISKLEDSLHAFNEYSAALNKDFVPITPLQFLVSFINNLDEIQRNRFISRAYTRIHDMCTIGYQKYTTRMEKYGEEQQFKRALVRTAKEFFL